MSIVDLIKSRRTVHKYRAEEVPVDVIEQALDAALFAPNHKLTFPWRFTLVGKDTRQKIADIAVSLKFSGCQPTLEQVEAVKSKILNPSHLVVFRCLRNPDDAFRAREDYATLACAIQNFSLALWEKQIGTKWSTGGPTRDPRTYQALGIDTEKEEIVGFLWAGVPEFIPQAAARPTLTEVLQRMP